MRNHHTTECSYYSSSCAPNRRRPPWSRAKASCGLTVLVFVHGRPCQGVKPRSPRTSGTWHLCPYRGTYRMYNRTRARDESRRLQSWASTTSIRSDSKSQLTYFRYTCMMPLSDHNRLCTSNTVLLTVMFVHSCFTQGGHQPTQPVAPVVEWLTSNSTMIAFWCHGFESPYIYVYGTYEYVVFYCSFLLFFLKWHLLLLSRVPTIAWVGTNRRESTSEGSAESLSRRYSSCR